MLAANFNIEYIADIVFILVLLIWAIVDGKKGFVSCFFSIISTIVCVLAVLFLSGPVLGWTNGLFGLEEVMQVGLGDWLSTVKPFDLDVSMDGWQTKMDEIALPAFLADAVLAEIQKVVGDIPAGTMLGQYLGVTIGTFAATILCAIVIFFLVKLIMLLLRGLLNKFVSSCKLFQKINVLGGMIAGAFKGFFVVCAVLAILSLIPSPELIDFFDMTLILGGLYYDNPIMVVFSWFVVS